MRGRTGGTAVDARVSRELDAAGIESGLSDRETAPADFESRTTDPPKHQTSESRPWSGRPVPAWAQAVAATLIFAAGLSLGVVRGHHADGGHARTAPVVVSQATASATELQALERRLRAEIARIQPASAGLRAETPVGPVRGASVGARAHPYRGERTPAAARVGLADRPADEGCGFAAAGRPGANSEQFRSDRRVDWEQKFANSGRC